MNTSFPSSCAGKCPVYERMGKFRSDPHWKDLFLSFEYFYGDIGAGVGASATKLGGPVGSHAIAAEEQPEIVSNLNQR